LIGRPQSKPEAKPGNALTGLSPVARENPARNEDVELLCGVLEGIKAVSA
jgi:hypothetical protein